MTADGPASARAAGLHYATDDRPGIRRLGRAGRFRYVDPRGRPVRDPETLRRIRALAIPPAYTEVWIATDPRAHVQATARDAKGRKQYRYHPRFREIRDEVKFDRMIAFAEALPRIRRGVARDLDRGGLTRERVLALVVRLLEQTRIRVGNEEYARKNHSFGLTTLKTRHVAVKGEDVRLSFRGKSGRHHTVMVHDRRVASVVRRCLSIPGQELFTWIDPEGVVHVLGSHDVNEYLRALSGADFTAKDFRTWAGTVMAADELRRFAPCSTAKRRKKQIAAAIEQVSARLGNTPSVCRKSYVHPFVLSAYLQGTMRRAEPRGGDLGSAERFTLALLKTAPSLAQQLEASIAEKRRRAA